MVQRQVYRSPGFSGSNGEFTAIRSTSSHSVTTEAATRTLPRKTILIQVFGVASPRLLIDFWADNESTLNDDWGTVLSRQSRVKDRGQMIRLSCTLSGSSAILLDTCSDRTELVGGDRVSWTALREMRRINISLSTLGGWYKAIEPYFIPIANPIIPLSSVSRKRNDGLRK